MNVYLWPNQSVMKNAYIGKVYEYSYDFRNKTQATITADWWTFWNTSYFSSNSDGISWNPIRVGYDISQYVPTANKITMSFVCSLYNSAAAWLRLIKAINDTTWITWLFVTTWSSNYRVPVIYWTSWTNVTPYSNWVYTNTVELDFVNKTYVSKSTWLSDINLTLTDTQISNIRNNIGVMYAYVDNANGTWHLKSVSITIE